MNILLARVGPAIGGAERYNQNLIAGFKKYFPADKSILLTNLRGLGGQILPFFIKEVGTKKDLLRLLITLPKYLWIWVREIRQLAEGKKGIDLIVLQGANEKIVLTPLLRLMGLKVCWIEHGPFFAFPSSKIVFWLYRRASFFANRIIAVSKNTKIDFKGNFKNLVVVKNAVDIDKFTPLNKKEITTFKKKIGIYDRNFIIGFLGDLCKDKGLDDFIKISRLIIKKDKRIKFVIVGKQNFEDNSFIFTGFLKKVTPILGIFDLIFYPTKMGSIPLSLLESMAMGVPVVTRDVGGNRELVVQGKTGILFKDEKPEELAKIIFNLLKNRKKREAMGKAGRERVVRYFNQERWIKEMRAVWEETISDK